MFQLTACMKSMRLPLGDWYYRGALLIWALCPRGARAQLKASTLGVDGGSSAVLEPPHTVSSARSGSVNSVISLLPTTWRWFGGVIPLWCHSGHWFLTCFPRFGSGGKASVLAKSCRLWAANEALNHHRDVWSGVDPETWPSSLSWRRRQTIRTFASIRHSFFSMFGRRMLLDERRTRVEEQSCFEKPRCSVTGFNLCSLCTSSCCAWMCVPT